MKIHCLFEQSNTFRDAARRLGREAWSYDLPGTAADFGLDADVVMMLYRDGYYKGNPADTSAELIIGKNRNGSVGTAHLTFDARHTRFADAGKTAKQDEGDNE